MYYVIGLNSLCLKVQWRSKSLDCPVFVPSRTSFADVNSVFWTWACLRLTPIKLVLKSLRNLTFLFIFTLVNSIILDMRVGCMGRVRVKGGVEAGKGLSRGQGRPGGEVQVEDYYWTLSQPALTRWSGAVILSTAYRYTRHTRTIIPDKMHSIHILIDS